MAFCNWARYFIVLFVYFPLSVYKWWTGREFCSQMAKCEGSLSTWANCNQKAHDTVDHLRGQRPRTSCTKYRITSCVFSLLSSWRHMHFDLFHTPCVSNQLSKLISKHLKHNLHNTLAHCIFNPKLIFFFESINNAINLIQLQWKVHQLIISFGCFSIAEGSN